MDSFDRRKFLAGAAAAAGAGLPFPSFGQAFPSKPIKMIIPFAPGGPTDTMTRLLAAHMSDELKQSVVAENRAGAGGNLGAEAVARSAPDGYTLLMGTNGPLAANLTLFKNLSYNPATAFEPISMYVYQPNMLAVHPSVPATNVRELIAWLKQSSAGVPYGSGGIGTSTHFAGELFRVMTGTKLDHVAYKGDGVSVPDAVAGNIQVIFCSVLAGVNWMRSGKLRVLGVTGATRVPLIPEIAPIAESGLPGFDLISWYSVLAAAGTPKDVVATLNGAMRRAMAHPELKSKLEAMGSILVPTTPEQLRDHINAEIPRWGKLVNELNIKL